MTRRCRCVQGPRSARNEYRHPGVPGTRNKGSPASSPNSDQATIRPPGRSRLRSRTPSRTASVTIGNPYKTLRLRQAKRRRRPAGGCPRFRSGEPRTGPQNTVPSRLPPRPDGGLGTRPRDARPRPAAASMSPPPCGPPVASHRHGAQRRACGTGLKDHDRAGAPPLRGRPVRRAAEDDAGWCLRPQHIRAHRHP